MIRKSGKTGSGNGLILNLFVNSDDYVGVLGQRTGVTVVIHSPYIEPDLAAHSVAASTGKCESIKFEKKIFSSNFFQGFMTEISVIRETITRLPHPYSRCTTEYPAELPMTKDKRQYAYNKNVCMKYCYQYYLNSICGCYDDYIVDVDSLCDYKNSSVAICKAKLNFQFADGELSCGCEQECDHEGYSSQMSMIQWPSEKYLPFFALHSWNEAIEDGLDSIF